MKKISDDKKRRKISIQQSDSGYKSSGKTSHVHLCRSHLKSRRKASPLSSSSDSDERPLRSSKGKEVIKAKRSKRIKTPGNKKRGTSLVPNHGSSLKRSKPGLGFTGSRDEGASDADDDVSVASDSGNVAPVFPSDEWKTKLLERMAGGHFEKGETLENAAPAAETSQPMAAEQPIPVRESNPVPPTEGEFAAFLAQHNVRTEEWTFLEETRWRKEFDRERELKAQLERESRQRAFQLELEESRRSHQAELEAQRQAQRQMEIQHREQLEREREERNREYQQLLFEQRVKQQQIEAQEATVRSGVEVTLSKAKFLAGVQQFATGTVVEIHTVVNEDEVLRRSKEALFKDFETRSQSENVSLSHGWRTGVSGGLFVVANAGYNGSTSSSSGSSLSSSSGERDSQAAISSILSGGYQTSMIKYTIVTTKSGLKVGVTSSASTTLDWDSACTLANSDTQVFLLGGELWYAEYTEILRIRSFMEKVNSFGRPMPYNFRKEITVSSENLLALAGQVEVLNREALLEKSRLFIETNSRQANLVQDLNAQLGNLKAAHDQAIERAKALNDESHRLRLEWNEKARHYELTIKEKDDIQERLEADRRALDAQKATLSKSHQELLKEYKKFVSRVTALIEAQLQRNDCANHAPVWMSQSWEIKMEDIKRTILEPQDWTELLTSWVFKPVQDRHAWLWGEWLGSQDEKANLVKEVAQLTSERDRLREDTDRLVADTKTEMNSWLRAFTQLKSELRSEDQIRRLEAEKLAIQAQQRKFMTEYSRAANQRRINPRGW